jgi:hypothetical protein
MIQIQTKQAQKRKMNIKHRGLYRAGYFNALNLIFRANKDL